MVAIRETSDIRVVILSSQRVFGECLALALDGYSDISIDSVVSTFDGEGLQSRRVGIVVIDLEALDAMLEDVVPAVRRQAPLASIIVLSRGSADTLHRSIESGADGHVSKEQGLAELRRAIYCVAGGVSYLGPRPVSPERSASNVPSVARLSPREREVLQLLTLGYANREIAGALNLQHKTVKNHVSNILSKLETSSRTQAVIHAIRRGIV